MKLFTFTAETPAAALSKAQNACGSEALVVSTKQIQKKGLGRGSLYEIVIAIDDAKENENTEQTNEQDLVNEEDVIVNISKKAQDRAKQDTVKTTTSSVKPVQLQKEDNQELSSLKSELSSLHDKIKLLQDMLWEDTKSDRKGLIIPPEFAEIYKIAKQSGMSAKHLEQIMSSTLEHMPSSMKDSPKIIKRYFQILLKKMITIKKESITKESTKIFMLVGPTGVGKTTTLAKLAARFSFLEHKYTVGLITLDTYRIAAVEQLHQYARMMKLPLHDVIDVVDFKRALESLSYCDLILIDTVGSSQFDREKILKLSEFLSQTNYDIDVELVISAATKLEDLNDIYENFSFLNIDSIIVTKLDETKSVGSVFSFVSESKKPLSYFSIGQEVPDDIVPADSDLLVKRILKGYDKAKA